ncbi:hypothetical protein BDP55DRAFT_654208 [Colletotrichum godetiae]|uniref:Uncharacterized protein n=1 Tax=Colletotrichum godetiae TaxID=1209918 RepID=A0AAJ0ARM0_9PEZI|nr:uncharacterized protein BDP55DRAFT_654208 [Colletotrichum godetiae]KAK1689100.1 hypothetical protein BDP55DRAFT_654208 [Colletotrichum godetiae]
MVPLVPLTLKSMYGVRTPSRPALISQAPKQTGKHAKKENRTSRMEPPTPPGSVKYLSHSVHCCLVAS